MSSVTLFMASISVAVHFRVVSLKGHSKQTKWRLPIGEVPGGMSWILTTANKGRHYVRATVPVRSGMDT